MNTLTINLGRINKPFETGQMVIFG
jgi:hypothetical protein